MDGYDWVIYDSNYNQIGMFKEKMIQGFTMIRGTLMTDKATKLSDVEVEFDFIQKYSPYNRWTYISNW